VCVCVSDRPAIDVIDVSIRFRAAQLPLRINTAFTRSDVNS
jgi:hypothetical protein